MQRRQWLYYTGATALTALSWDTQAQSGAPLDKCVVAGWSKPITEITNL